MEMKWYFHHLQNDGNGNAATVLKLRANRMFIAVLFQIDLRM